MIILKGFIEEIISLAEQNTTIRNRGRNSTDRQRANKISSLRVMKIKYKAKSNQIFKGIGQIYQSKTKKSLFYFDHIKVKQKYFYFTFAKKMK